MIRTPLKTRCFSILSAIAVTMTVGFTGSAQAAISWQFSYLDVINSTGIGFDDAALGQARRDALQQAGNDYGALFADTATITMEVKSLDDPASTTLASAGSNFMATGSGNFGGAEVVRQKVLTGTDLNGGALDGNVEVNFGSGFNISANPGDIGPTEFDFFSTMFHELNHALGHLSAPDEAGTDLFSNGGAGEWSLFDQFIVDVNGNPIIDPTTFMLNQAIWDAGKVGGASPAGGLFFNGANAVAANGGNAVGLYTPPTFDAGSSVSHLDDDNPALAGLLMLAATSPGPSARTLSDIERAMYEDLGYTMAAAVPEPGDLYLLFGIGLLGLLAYSRPKADLRFA